MGIGLVRLEVGGNNTLLSVLFFCLACVLSVSPLYAQPEISAPMTDSLSADTNNDGQADPGDTLEYTTTITNTGHQNADSVLFSLTPDPNTTLVSGSVQISPLADDQIVTTNADTDLVITLTGSDGDGDPLTFSLVSPPANGSLGPLTPLSPTSAQVTYTPTSGFTGTDSFTFTVNDGTADANEVGTVSMTVQPAGTPIADGQMVTTNEDTTVPITLTGSDPDNEPLAFTVVGNPTNGVLSGTAPHLTYAPNVDFNGSDSFTFRVSNGTNDSAVATVSITVNAVNDQPSFTASDPPIINEDAGPQIIPNWAAFNPGAANETGQTAAYLVSSVGNPGLFSTLPTIDATGTLTYTAAADAFGTSTFEVVVQDDGGTDNGGVDTSASQTFTITVNAVNDQPSFTASNPPTINEDAGPQTIMGWATFDPGAANEAGQTALYTVSNVSNPGLFSAPPTVDADGTLTYTSAANAFGTSTFEVVVQDGGGTDNGGVDTSASQTFTITVNAVDDPPVAMNDSYTGAIGNTTGLVSVTAPSTPSVGLTGPASVLGNDSDIDGPAVQVVAGVIMTTNGGEVDINADGSFTYDPPRGFTGTDSFTYTLQGPGAVQGTVQVTVSNMVWYIDNSAGAGDGRSTSPYNSLAAFNADQGGGTDDPMAGDTIFIYQGGGNYTGGISLLDNQRLLGEGVDLVVGGTMLVTGGGDAARPTITNGAGNGITLAQGNTVQGLNVGDASGAGIAGTAVGTATVSSVNVTNGTGAAVTITTSGSLSMTFGSLSSTNSSTTGIALTGVGGTFSSGTTTIQNPAGAGIQVQNTTAGAGVSFGDTTVMGSGGTGVNLQGNSGNVTFADLDITPDSGQRGLFASANTGTITATSGTIAATNIAAVEVVGTSAANTTPLNLTLTSVSANGGTNGIALTDTSGSFTVTGTGTAGSGGTIQNITARGASFINATNISLSYMNFQNANTTDGATSDGLTGGNENTDENGALHFASVVQVDLDNLQISDTAQHGINGNDVTDFDISNTVISGTGDAVWESGIYLFQLKGLASAGRTNTFSNVEVSDTGQFNLAVINSEGSNLPPGEKDRLELTNCAFQSSGVAVIGDHVSVLNQGTANFQTVVTGSSFAATAGRTSDSIQVDASNTASSDVSISTSTFVDGNVAINLSGSGSGSTTFSVANNSSVSSRAGNTVNIASNGSASLRGTIANNSISTNVGNNAGSGIDLVVDATGSIIADINGNTINGQSTGIRGGARNAGTGTADLTIRNNTITSGGTSEFAGIWLFAGNGSSDETNRTCVNFVSNAVDITTGVGFVDYYLEQFTGNTFQIQGLTGSGTDAANVSNFVAGTDTDPSPTDPTVNVNSGTAVSYTAAECATP